MLPLVDRFCEHVLKELSMNFSITGGYLKLALDKAYALPLHRPRRRHCLAHGLLLPRPWKRPRASPLRLLKLEARIRATHTAWSRSSRHGGVCGQERLLVSGYCGLLIGSPIILYEIIAFVLPGLTKDERKFLGPIVLGSSVLFYLGILFSYTVLAPAALNFFVNYAEGAVESIWSIDQYFEFVLVLLFSTGLSFQVPVIQLLLGQVGLVSSEQMLSIWRYVVVGAVVAAAVLTPSTDPLTQMLLAGPLLGLYLGGAWMVRLIGR
ncbi:hypothetical protein QYE76_046000 [Lolium multiflorum]|uniref:Sec-independent protein translocase protein TatC n=1 Tax=Lolium multiflorum TaxID=4521 RepID=A0AAD8TNW8_LOLMU|nr:hypothetical protein QYE76_046000 [Lolium multiflorum]